MPQVDPQAPENLDNYLLQIVEAKKVMADLSEKIASLKTEQAELQAENSKIFADMHASLAAKIKEADDNVTESRKRLIDVNAQTKANSDTLATIESQQLAHLNNVANFSAECDAKRSEWKKAIVDANAQKDANDVAAKENVDRKLSLDERQKALDETDRLQKERQEQLNALANKNESDLQINANAFNSLQAQSDKLHSQIEEERTSRLADIATMQKTLDKATQERQINESILAQITEKTNRLQDLTLNQKLLSTDIDRKNSLLIAQQEKTSEMINRLQALKDELSKEPTTEVAK
jgi:hypothetical protein